MDEAKFKNTISIVKGNVWFKKSLEINLDKFKKDEYLTNAFESYKMAENELSGKIGLANCFYLKEKYETAEILYNEIIEKDANNAAGLIGKANCLYKLKKLEEAKEFYEKAKSCDSNSSR